MTAAKEIRKPFTERQMIAFAAYAIAAVASGLQLKDAKSFLGKDLTQEEFDSLKERIDGRAGKVVSKANLPEFTDWPAAIEYVTTTYPFPKTAGSRKDPARVEADNQYSELPTSRPKRVDGEKRSVTLTNTKKAIEAWMKKYPKSSHMETAEKRLAAIESTLDNALKGESRTEKTKTKKAKVAANMATLEAQRKKMAAITAGEVPAKKKPAAKVTVVAKKGRKPAAKKTRRTAAKKS